MIKTDSTELVIPPRRLSCSNICGSLFAWQLPALHVRIKSMQCVLVKFCGMVGLGPMKYVGIGISTVSISQLVMEIFLQNRSILVAILKSKIAAIRGTISDDPWTKNLCTVLL